MERKVLEVRQALEAAERASAQALNGKNIAGTVLGALAPGAALAWWALPAVLTSDGSQAVAGSIRRARELFTRWADAEGVNGMRRWALRGSEPDGKGGFRPYTVAYWLVIGDSLLSELGTAKREAAVSTTSAAATQTLAKTATEVKTAAEKAKQAAEDAGKKLAGPWPLSWKLAAGGVAVVAVGSTLAWLLSEVNSLTGKEGA